MTILCRYTELQEGLIIKISKVNNDVHVVVYKNDLVVYQESRNIETDKELADLPFNEVATLIFKSLYSYLGYNLHHVVDEFYLYKLTANSREFHATIIRANEGFTIYYLFKGLPCKVKVSDWKTVKNFIKNCVVELNLISV